MELFRTFLSYAPEHSPEDQYVPDEKFTEAWNDSRQPLQDCMNAHFQYRPGLVDESMLLNHCISLIEEVGKTMNKRRNLSTVREMLKIKSGKLWKTHLNLNEESARQHQEDLEEEAQIREETPKERAD